MIPSHHWARNFTVTDDDIEYLTGLLLERETPLSSADLARALIEWRIQNEADDFQERFRDVQVYNPAQSYQVGQKVVFPIYDYALATVTDVRPGDNVIVEEPSPPRLLDLVEHVGARLLPVRRDEEGVRVPFEQLKLEQSYEQLFPQGRLFD